MRAANRVLPLEGGRNFRDLGGYETEDGRRVRWCRLFRSGAMARLTPSDYSYLSTLGIRVVCDFRSRAERADEPTRWLADPAPRFLAWDGAIQEDESPLIAALAADDASQEMVREASQTELVNMSINLIPGIDDAIARGGERAARNQLVGEAMSLEDAIAFALAT